MLDDAGLTAWLSAGLVSWLITLYLVYTDGPPLPRIGPVFLWLRKKAGFRAGFYVNREWVWSDELGEEDVFGGVPEEQVAYRHEGQWLAQLLSCHRCTGFWVGLVLGVVLFGLKIEALGVMALGILLHEFSSRS